MKYFSGFLSVEIAVKPFQVCEYHLFDFWQQGFGNYGEIVSLLFEKHGLTNISGIDG